MGNQRVHRLFRAMDDVQYAFREARFEEEFRQPYRAKGRSLRWFQDKGVPGDDGEGKHPQGDHHREVEGWDTRDDTERVAVVILIHATTDLPERPPLQEGRRAAREVHDLDAAPRLAARLIKRLAVVACDNRRQFVNVFVQKRLIAEHQLHAVHHRRL